MASLLQCYCVPKIVWKGQDNWTSQQLGWGVYILSVLFPAGPLTLIIDIGKYSWSSLLCNDGTTLIGVLQMTVPTTRRKGSSILLMPSAVQSLHAVGLGANKASISQDEWPPQKLRKYHCYSSAGILIVPSTALLPLSNVCSASLE